MTKATLRHQVVEVYVDSCCGSWCVMLKDFTNSTFRVARVDSWEKGSKQVAEAYAKKLATLLINTKETKE